MFELDPEPGLPLDDVREVSNYAAALDHGLRRLDDGFPLNGSWRAIFRRHAQRLPDISYVERIENADAPDVKLLLAVIKDCAGRDAFDPQRLEPLELLDEILGKSCRGFDFHRREQALFPDKQIDLVAVGVTEEIDLWSDSLVERAFHDVRDNEIFVQTSAQRVAEGLLGRVDAE